MQVSLGVLLIALLRRRIGGFCALILSFCMSIGNLGLVFVSKILGVDFFQIGETCLSVLSVYYI